MIRSTRLLFVLSCSLLGACGGDSGPAPFQELYDLGLDRFVGTPEVMPLMQWDEPSSVNPTAVTHYHYGPLDPQVRRPLCMRGAEFQIDVEEGDSTELMIFMQGGGVCLEEVCVATDKPIPLPTVQVLALYGGGGVLNRMNPENPLAEADTVYVPYCDGSIFAGDVDRMLRGSMAYQRGLLNATAALEVAKLRFPHPSRIVLVGTSGGSYGSLPTMGLLRRYYPHTEVVVVSDSGAPIGKDQDVTFMRRTMLELNADFVPPSRPDCVADGHLTGLVEWALDHDAHTRYGYMGHAEDGTIGGTFLGITGEQMAVGVKREIGELLDLYPERTSAFVIDGTIHTFVQDISLIGAAGDALFPGGNLGAMTEVGVDGSGETITGWQWLRRFLKGPGGQNVMPP